jgi:hypothetical protein
MSHPLLDTLGVSVSTRPVNLAGGTTTSLILSIPSASTIVARKCTAVQRQLGDAALVGVVTEADTDAPLPGAEVLVAWTDFAVSAKTVEKTPQRRSSKVAADGSYMVCGIPSDLQTGIVAIREQDSTAEIPVSFANRLVIQSFHLPRTVDSTAASGPSDKLGVVSGRVTNSQGAPIEGARIAVESDNTATTSEASGAFRLTGVWSGTRLVTIRKLGYAANELAVDVSAVSARLLDVKMDRVPQTLEPVRVTALRDIGLQRVGFSERKRLGAGTYLGPKEIEGRNAPRLGFLLETVPVLKRYACIRYWVDGHMWSTLSDDDASQGPDAFLSGAEIAAVEVYGPLAAPAEYIVSSKRGACASVVVWTKAKVGM